MAHAPHPFGVAFDTIQHLCMQRAITPQPLWKIKRKLQIGSERRFTRVLREIDSFVYGIVAARRSDLSSHADSGDLLSLFLHDAKERGEELTDKQLRDLIL